MMVTRVANIIDNSVIYSMDYAEILFVVFLGRDAIINGVVVNYVVPSAYSSDVNLSFSYSPNRILLIFPHQNICVYRY